jgi:hypothetical protein
MALVQRGAIAVGGAGTALFLAGSEMPVRKAEIKPSAKMDEVQGSTSGFGNVIWGEFGRGNSTWTLTASGVFRVESILVTGLPTGNSPFDVIEGLSYSMTAYVFRPGFLGVGNAGMGYWGNIIVEDAPVPVFDPNSGGLEWSLSAKGQGPLNGPGVPPVPAP